MCVIGGRHVWVVCSDLQGACVSVDCLGSWGCVVYVCVGRCLGVASVNVCLEGVFTCVRSGVVCCVWGWSV